LYFDLFLFCKFIHNRKNVLRKRKRKINDDYDAVLKKRGAAKLDQSEKEKHIKIAKKKLSYIERGKMLCKKSEF